MEISGLIRFYNIHYINNKIMVISKAALKIDNIKTNLIVKSVNS